MLGEEPFVAFEVFGSVLAFAVDDDASGASRCYEGLRGAASSAPTRGCRNEEKNRRSEI